MGRERKRWIEKERERRKSKNASPPVLRKHREPICPVCVDRAQCVLFSELKTTAATTTTHQQLNNSNTQPN